MSENTGIIFDIKKYAVHDGPGIRTTVFFKGCPMQCWWCHNPESRACEPQMVEKIIEHENRPPIIEKTKIGKEMSVTEVMTEIKKDRIFYDESGGGVTFSGGEPLLQADFLLELLNSCKLEGLHTVLDTSGYASSATVKKVIDKTDLFLYDLKLMDENAHQKFTGVSNGPVQENFRLISEYGKPVQVRVPVIPSITDTTENLDALLEFIRQFKNITEVNLLPYHKIGSHKYQRLGMMYQMQGVEKPAGGEMASIKKMFEDSGYLVTIGG